MTLSPPPIADQLDFAAAERFPGRAAAHILGVGLLLTVLVALPAAPTDLDRHQLPKETVLHLAVWLAVLLARPFPPRGLRPAMWLGAGLLAGAAVVSGLLASNGWLALRAASLIISGLAGWMVARHVAEQGHARILLGWVAVAGVVAAATGLLQAYGVSSVLFATTRVPGGTFGNRNFMAHFCVLSLPVILLIALTSTRKLRWTLACSGAALLVAAIVLTRSRAAWIGLAAELIVFAIALLAAKRRSAIESPARRARWLGMLLATGVAVALVVPNRLAWKSTSPYTDTLAGLANRDEGSGRGRVLQYRHTLVLAEQHPVVGVGPGNWPIRYGDVAPGNDPSWVWGDVIPLNPWPSSDWIALASELGLAGVVAVLLLGAAVSWRGVVAARGFGDQVFAGTALLALVGGCLIQGTFDAVLLLPAPLLLIGISAGALLERGDPTAHASVQHAARFQRAWLLLPLLLAAVSLRSTLQTAAYIIADSGHSLRRLSWAARLDPGSYPIRIALAERLPCTEARRDILAVERMAPTWPATVAAGRRCGVRLAR